MSLLLLCTSVPQDTSYIFRHTVTDTLVVPGCTFNKKLPEYNCTHTWYKNWERGKRRMASAEEKGRRLFVGGLSGDTTDASLRAHFASFFPVVLAEVSAPSWSSIQNYFEVSFSWTSKRKPRPYCFLPRTQKMIRNTQLWQINSIGLNGFYATLYHNVIAGDWKN